MTRLKDLLLQHTSMVLFGVVFVVFGLLAPRFLALENLMNILVQSSVLVVGAVGMTFVLLTAGIDLSVGSIMFLAAVPAGHLVQAGHSPWLALLAALGVALIFGAVNAFVVVRLKVMPFVVTLATLYIGRGLGLYITQTRAMNLPESILAVGSATVLGVPLVLLVAAFVAFAAHYTLARTPFGRQVYAVGQDGEGARKAGLPVDRIRFITMTVCAVSAGLAGFLTIARVGVVSPSMGNQRELAIIAAAVLGGTSLFGGRGQVFPGAVLGAILIQTVETGLVILNVDPYLYPFITATIIFVAVAIDSVRNLEVAKRALRKIRPLGV
ncbi:MAG: ABC transporter permease [Deltaproteobacteria bacterium]|nr:ABC transporter permease [Deltaproteobacteria bacterium]